MRAWDPEARDFGVCFTQLALTLPTHALLALVSAYFAGALAGSLSMDEGGEARHISLPGRICIRVCLSVGPLSL